jgi:O-antigen ligase
MNDVSSDRLDRALLFFYLLFVFGSTFARALAQMSLGVALVIFLIIVIRERYQPFVRSLRWFYIPVGLYLVWLLLSGLISKDPSHSLYACRKEWLFVAVPIGIYLFQKAELKMRTLQVLAIGVAFFSLYGIVEYFTNTDWLNFEGGSWSPIPVDYQISGMYERTLTYAGYYSTVALALLTTALALKGKWNGVRFWFVGVAALGLIVTGLTLARGPVVYAGVGLVVLALAQRKAVRWSVLAGLVVLVAIAAVQPSMRDRFREAYDYESQGTYVGSRHFIWANSWELIKERPLFGVGNGNFMTEYRIQVGPRVPTPYVHGQAHNDLINSAAIGGIPCGVFFAAIWLAAFGYLGKGARSKKFGEVERMFCFAALIGSLVFFMNSMTDSTFASEETHELIMVIWALGLAPWYNRGTKKEPELRA